MIRLGAVGLVVLAGCSTSNPDWCEPLDQFASKPDSASDPLRVGYRLTSYADTIAGLSNGSVLVPTCTDVATIDASGKESTHIATDQAITLATGPDDTIYAVTRNPTDHFITAATPDGSVKWKAAATGAGHVIGSADGAYTELETFPTPATLQTSIVAYDAATGTTHTVRADSTQESIIGPGPGGGVITEIEGPTSTTVQQLDITGATLWTLTATAATTPNGNVPRVHGAALAPDGGVVIYGEASSSVELGGFSIPIDAEHDRAFLAGLDAHGAVQWGYPLDLFPRSIAVAAEGDVILAGGIGVNALGGSDALGVVRARATGVVATRSLPVAGGTSFGAVPAGDGAVWLQAPVLGDPNDSIDARLQVGDHVLTDPAYYLLQLAL